MSAQAPEPWDWTQATLPRGEVGFEVSEVLDGRYALKEPLGAGAQGRVIAAYDAIAKERVAVKLVPELFGSGGRLEIAALRMVRSPHVVRLLDEGKVPGGRYLVMELVDGDPLPTGPMAWPKARALVVGVLRALHALHREGLTHRDLKLDNLRLRDRQPVLLDLGLSLAPPPGPGELQGSLSTMSPEQLRGEPATPKSDLYALGQLLYRWLTGRPAQPGSPAELREARLMSSPAPIGSIRPGLPRLVKELVHSLLERDPALRPPSAEWLLHALGEQTPRSQAAALLQHHPERCQPRDLEGLFAGHKRVVHIPDDAARVLYQATGGHRSVVQEVLTQWITRGHVQLQDGKLHTDRATLERLRLGHEPLPTDPGLRLAEMLRRSEFTSQHQGLASEGHEWARQAMLLALDLQDLERAREACELLTQARSQERSASGMQDTLRLLERANREGVAIDDLMWLLRGITLVVREPERAREAFRNAGRFQRASLDTATQGGLSRSYLREPEHLRALLWGPELEAWATDPARLASLHSWRSHFLYQQRDWAGARDEALRAAQHQTSFHKWARSMSSAMFASLELEDYELLDEHLIPLLLRSEGARHTTNTLHIQMCSRSRDVRMDLPTTPRPWLSAAAEDFGMHYAASFALLETGLAWRRGLHADGRAIAERALRQPLIPHLRLVIQALYGLCGGIVSVESLLEELPSVRMMPQFRVQLLGLIAALGGRPSPELLSQLLAIKSEHPEIDWSRRLDICSPAEAESACRTGSLQNPALEAPMKRTFTLTPTELNHETWELTGLSNPAFVIVTQVGSDFQEQVLVHAADIANYASKATTATAMGIPPTAPATFLNSQGLNPADYRMATVTVDAEPITGLPNPQGGMNHRFTVNNNGGTPAGVLYRCDNSGTWQDSWALKPNFVWGDATHSVGIVPDPSQPGAPAAWAAAAKTFAAGGQFIQVTWTWTAV